MNLEFAHPRKTADAAIALTALARTKYADSATGSAPFSIVSKNISDVELRAVAATTVAEAMDAAEAEAAELPTAGACERIPARAHAITLELDATEQKLARARVDLQAAMSAENPDDLPNARKRVRDLAAELEQLTSETKIAATAATVAEREHTDARQKLRDGHRNRLVDSLRNQHAAAMTRLGELLNEPRMLTALEQLVVSGFTLEKMGEIADPQLSRVVVESVVP